MPLKNHWISANDVVYELLEDVLQSINEIVAFLEVDDQMMNFFKGLVAWDHFIYVANLCLIFFY
jgi:2-hydroxy-3-keto-5-methylthiopentenyl-1-phosphate phosphatase